MTRTQMIDYLAQFEVGSYQELKTWDDEQLAKSVKYIQNSVVTIRKQRSMT